MKNRNLNAVDSFSSPPSKRALHRNDEEEKATLDDKLIDLYAPDPYLVDAPKKDINISIKLSVPSDLIIEEKVGQAIGWFKKRLKSLQALVSGRRFQIAAAGLVIIIIGVYALGLLPGKTGGNNPPGDVQGVSTSPNFSALVPSGYDNSGVRYDPKRKVASYSHTIRGVEVVVSQQPLPENFKPDPQARVSELAKRFNATKEIEAGEVTAFAGKSADGPQSVIFQKKGLLIFIYSPVELDSQALTSFIKEL